MYSNLDYLFIASPTSDMLAITSPKLSPEFCKVTQNLTKKKTVYVLQSPLGEHGSKQFKSQSKKSILVL